MPRSRQQRYIHSELLRNNVIPFERWKYEGKDLSYFHKNIIDYDYKTRTHIFMSSGRYRQYFPIKVKHRGWPAKSPMTPQAWTAMELLAGLQYMIYNHETMPEDLYEGLYFISTCILKSEVELLWDELLNSVYICTEDKADLWVAILYCIITGIQNGKRECDITNPSHECVKDRIITFLNRSRKIDLLREIYYNRRDSFDRFIRWIFRNGPTPLIFRRFFSLERTFWEHRDFSLHDLPSPSPPNIAYSYRPQSPLEQISTLDSVSSQPSPSEESP